MTNKNPLIKENILPHPRNLHAFPRIIPRPYPFRAPRARRSHPEKSGQAT
jgi:hypothetical protein